MSAQTDDSMTFEAETTIDRHHSDSILPNINECLG